VYALSASAASIYAGGRFSFVGGAVHNNLVNVDLNGLPAAWNPNPNGDHNSVRAVLEQGGALYVGGDFTQVDTEARRGFAIFAP
jgi:hypothetical protein